MIADIIVLSVVALILGAVIFYIVRQKKKGVKCIGCPAGEAACRASGCGGSCSGCSGTCGGHSENR